MLEVLRVSPWRSIARALGVLLCATAAHAGVPEGEAELQMSGMVFVSTRGASRDLTVEADRAGLRTAERRARLESVRARVAGSEGRASLDMRCDRAELDLDSGDLHAQGHVRGRTGDGRRFETTRLHLDRAAGVVWTDAPVVISDAGGVFHGGGFRYDLREERMTLSGGARVDQEP